MNDSYEYTVISVIRHFNKKFLVLFNKINGMYFLEITDNGYDYPTLEEFMKLKKIYNPFRGNAYYTKMNVKPLVKFKNKLVSAILVGTMLFCMTGCSNEQSTLKYLTESGVTISDGLTEDDNIFFITGIDFENSKSEELFGEIEPDFKYSYNETVTINEFTKRLGIENKTYNDVIEVLKLNPNIDDNIKTILEEGINNLRDSNFDINLGLLYYNIKDLKIVYSNSLVTKGAIAVFNENNREVSVLDKLDQTKYENVYKTVMIHEVIGHGSTSAYSEDLKILCGPETLMILADESGKITSTLGFGNAFKEGLAELITCRATNKKMTCQDFYSTESYMVQLISELYDIPLSEMADIGIEKLASKLEKEGIDDAIVLFEALDTGMYGKMANSLETDVITTQNALSVITNYIGKQSNNGQSKENIINKIKKTFDNMRNFFEYEREENLGEILYSPVSENCFTYIGVEYIHKQALKCCNQLAENNFKR